MGRSGSSWVLLILITDRGGKGKSAGLDIGRSSGVEKTDTRYNEWEGVVRLGSSSSSSQTEVGKVRVQVYTVVAPAGWRKQTPGIMNGKVWFVLGPPHPHHRQRWER